MGKESGTDKYKEVIALGILALLLFLIIITRVFKNSFALSGKRLPAGLFVAYLV